MLTGLHTITECIKAMTGDKETFVTRIYPQVETAGNIKSMTINVGSRSAIYMNIADVKKPNADANASKLESKDTCICEW